MGSLAALLVTGLAVCSIARGADARPLWLAVAPGQLADAIQPLADHRKAQGLEIVISRQTVEQAIAGAPRKPSFLLLVGHGRHGSQSPEWRVRAKRLKLYRWRQEQAEEYASDAAWGDLDGDGEPEVPVGRLHVRSPQEANAAVAKLLAYERRAVGDQDLSLVAWAGSPNYNPVIDAAAVTLLLGSVRMNRPPWMEPWLVVADPRHALCGRPSDQPSRFVARLKQGAMLAVLVGHASAQSFYSMSHQGQDVRFSAELAKDLAHGPPVAPMVILSCSCGDFTSARGCLAASLFAMEGGPVAVIAATTESHPLTNYYSGVCLLRTMGGSQRRLGSLWLEAQRAAARERNFVIERLLRDVEGKLEPEINIERLRKDQHLMYALLGDPAMPLAIPEPLDVTVEAVAGGWRWKARRPEGARTLSVSLAQADPVLPVAGADASPQERDELFQSANRALAFDPLPAPAGGAAWEGQVEQAGWLRIVARGSGRTWAAAVELLPPAGATTKSTE